MPTDAGIDETGAYEPGIVVIADARAGNGDALGLSQVGLALIASRTGGAVGGIFITTSAAIPLRATEDA